MPRVAVLAGINGAGKTTASAELLRDVLKIPIYVNADVIARGLNGIQPDSEAFHAGRIMLERMNDLVSNRESFAFETTLAARTYSAWLNNLRLTGYEVYLFYYWLSSPELAIARVSSRVKAGGHFVSDETIRLRYSRSVKNFFEIYLPISDLWEVYDNSGEVTRMIGCGFAEDYRQIVDPDCWLAFERSQYHGEVTG